jgi:hypothetical protein
VRGACPCSVQRVWRPLCRAPGFGGLRRGAASTALGSSTDALIWSLFTPHGTALDAEAKEGLSQPSRPRDARPTAHRGHEHGLDALCRPAQHRPADTAPARLQCRLSAPAGPQSRSRRGARGGWRRRRWRAARATTSPSWSLSCGRSRPWRRSSARAARRAAARAAARSHMLGHASVEEVFGAGGQARDCPLPRAHARTSALKQGSGAGGRSRSFPRARVWNAGRAGQEHRVSAGGQPVSPDAA